MFDGMLKSKFYCKCKSDVKLTRARADLVKKKRNAMQKYLRNDIADLLKNGLDINAYGRAEGLLVEMNLTSCYEFVDQCCEHISKNLSAMDKQKECPEECREAVSSLMFAAARYADMPELRELRTLFSERYGNSLDLFINKEFSENMRSCLPSKESKLQLLQEIAAESGLDWDSKALENKLYNESAYNKKESNDKVTRNEDRLPKKNQTPELRKRHDQVPPVKDIQVDTITRTEKPKGEELVKKVQTHETDEKLLEQKKSIPAPPYTKPEPNKPGPEIRPVPKSVRRRFTKPEIKEEDNIQRLNREKAEQGQRILRFLDNDGRKHKDEEEKMMDRLLRHYSKKNGQSSVADEKGKSVKPHRANRVGSLPAALLDHPPEEASMKHSRTFSLDNNNAHVHPKLPDYDDFVARLAELRKNRGN
ncbi:Regulator of Vps4 activity in the MVB pathway protein [Striga hermonthica]|uniref:Regulator of Vps4 activity in the MVB pathway protein n=1 Tax=Striga hermonthica TaxID=68872 RepID=A0A9N7NXU8_STRHE|nr:Regulator of Vps4 activity in the MVB pathway protein [Striga hermonthica]